MNLRFAIVAALLAGACLAAARANAQGISPSPAPTATASPSAKADEIEFGLRVPGRPNYLRSPYAPDAGLVDVTGWKPGDEVRCPYTKKIFLIPVLP